MKRKLPRSKFVFDVSEDGVSSKELKARLVSSTNVPLSFWLARPVRIRNAFDAERSIVVDSKSNVPTW